LRPTTTTRTALSPISECWGHEVARAILKRFEGTRATPEYWDGQVRKELGQVILVALGMVALEGYSVTELVLETLEHLRGMNPDDRRAED
jgi:hypothetical protein